MYRTKMISKWISLRLKIRFLLGKIGYDSVNSTGKYGKQLKETFAKGMG